VDKVTLIFVGGDSKVDKLITGVTGGTKSHVAGLILDGTYESLGVKDGSDLYPGVWLHSPQKYLNNSDAEFVEIEVPNLDALKAEARRLLGRPYGYTDCIRTGIYEIFGIAVDDNDYVMDCSETWTRLLRAGGLDILPTIQPGCISPAKLYEGVSPWLVKVGG